MYILLMGPPEARVKALRQNLLRNIKSHIFRRDMFLAVKKIYKLGKEAKYMDAGTLVPDKRYHRYC